MQSEKRRYLTRVEAGTIVASALAIAFGLAYAASPSPHMIGSLFGLAPQQTVRVSIASNASPTIVSDTDTIKLLPPDPCFVQFKIFDSTGAVAMQTDYLKIMPGTSFSRDLKFEDVAGGTILKAATLGATDFTNRVQLRVASYVSSADLTGVKIDHKASSCASDMKFLKLSVEVFDDASGKTTFMVPTDSLLPAVQ